MLDLFSGLGGWSVAFKNRGHEVITIDRDYSFNPTYVRDIGELDNLRQFGKYDVILASPPCEKFSLFSAVHNWKGNKPQNLQTIKAVELVEHFKLLLYNNKENFKFAIIENPVGKLREIYGKPDMTIDQCAYGRQFKKPTDLWGWIPKSFEPKRCSGKGCKHVRTPHDKHTISRGGVADYKKYSDRSKIPYGLSLAMCVACEKDLDKGNA